MTTQTDARRKAARPLPKKTKAAAQKKLTIIRAKRVEPAGPPLPGSRKKSGLSIKLFSRLTGFSERAIAGWEAGEPVSEAARRRLLETERFRERLSQVVKPEAIPAWLDTPNEAFGGLKPVEVVERGEIDRLWSMIFYLESGVAS